MTAFLRKLRGYIDEVYKGRVLPCSRACGFKRGTMESWLERGSAPGLDRLQQLAAATGIHITYWATDGVPPMNVNDARAWSQWLVGKITGESANGVESERHRQLLEDSCRAASRLVDVLREVLDAQHSALERPDEARALLDEVAALRLLDAELNLEQKDS